MKIIFYFHVIDKLGAEFKNASPLKSMTAFLDVCHFNAIDAKARISRLLADMVNLTQQLM